MRIRSVKLSFFLVVTLLASGCQTTVERQDGTVPMPRENAQVVVVKPKPVASNGPRAKTTKDPADPCSVRMQDMIGPLFLYFALHQRLPDKLDELRSLADVDVELNFTCPASGQPYIYNPTGLQAPAGGTLNLVLFDATPAHNGHRWGVVAGRALNKKNQGFFQAFVVDLSEQVFKTYTPIVAPPAEPAAAAPPEAPPPGEARPGDSPPASSLPGNPSPRSDTNDTPQTPGVPAGRP